MSQQLTTQQESTLSKWLARPEARQTITGALAGYLDTDEFLSQLLIHIQTTPATKFAPALADCTVASQYKAVSICATLGLLPNYQQVALIPRKNNNVWELTVMTQWQGYKALFERVPDVSEARVAAVHVSDHFVTGGDGMDIQVLEHRFDPLDPKRQIAKIADIRGTYCRFTFRDGRPDRFHFAPSHYIAQCKSCAGTDVIWNKWFEQMALKTAFRSAYSRRAVNVDPVVQGRLEAFLKHEDALLGNDPRLLDSNVTVIEHTPAPSRAAALAQRLNQRPTAQTPVQPASELLPPEETPLTVDATPDPAEAQEHAQTEQEPEQATDSEPNDTVADFMEMWSQVSPKNETALRRLHKHFTTSEPPLSSEDLRRVEAKFNDLLATFTRTKNERQQQNPLIK